MPDESNTVVQPSAPASEGAAAETKATTPVAATPSPIDEDTLRRVVQSQTDKAVKAQTRRLEAQIEDLAGLVRGNMASMVDIAPEEAKGAIQARANQASQASGQLKTAMDVIEDALQNAGLDAEDDLGLSVGDIAQNVSQSAFAKMVAKVVARKGSAPPAPVAKQADPVQEKIAALELKIAELTGATTVPMGGGTVAGPRVHRTPADWTDAELDAKLKSMGLSDPQ